MTGSRKHRRFRFGIRRRALPGAAPGTLSVDPGAPPPAVQVMAYDGETLVERQLDDVEQCRELLGSHKVTWVNVDGLGDAETVKKLGAIFGLHRLALEDVVNVHQRAKVEEYGDTLFIVVRMPFGEDRVSTEQLSIFVGKNFVLTFQERAGDCLDLVRDRLRKGRPTIRGSGADYLAYALIDAVVDAYFPILDAYNDRAERLEQDILAHSDYLTISEIHDLKHELRVLRRAVWPHREAMAALLRDALPLIKNETRIHLRDCYDHVVQLVDILELHREVGTDLRDLYLSMGSQRMNEVMKVLTIIATIFIPLSFIAGVYGMNFSGASPWSMPELHWYWGYPFALTVMFLLATGMLYWFRRAGWIGRRSTLIGKPSSLDGDQADR